MKVWELPQFLEATKLSKADADLLDKITEKVEFICKHHNEKLKRGEKE